MFSVLGIKKPSYFDIFISNFKSPQNFFTKVFQKRYVKNERIKNI